jgi:hypothetical protein
MLEQGIHFDVPSAVYFADPCERPSLTQSIAKVLIEQSPLHAWHAHPRLGGKPDEPDDAYNSAQAIGNAAHKLMIGRGKEIEVVDLDSWRGKAADQRREIEAAGKVAILSKHFARARSMVDVAQQTVSFEDGHGEVVVIAQNEDGLWLRSMIDFLPYDLRTPTDFKTTGLSCAPHAIPSMMLNGGWDIQAAMHETILDYIDPDNAGRRHFRFIAQENYPPYALTVCELPEAVLTMGRKKLDMATTVWRVCMREDVWPGYPGEIIRPEYPGWAESKWLDREMDYAERRKSRQPEKMMPSI